MAANDDLFRWQDSDRQPLHQPPPPSADLRSQVEYAIAQNITVETQTDAVLVIFKGWLREHAREAKEPTYQHYERLSGMVDEH